MRVGRRRRDAVVSGIVAALAMSAGSVFAAGDDRAPVVIDSTGNVSGTPPAVVYDSRDGVSGGPPATVYETAPFRNDRASGPQAQRDTVIGLKPPKNVAPGQPAVPAAPATPATPAQPDGGYSGSDQQLPFIPYVNVTPGRGSNSGHSGHGNPGHNGSLTGMPPASRQPSQPSFGAPGQSGSAGRTRLPQGQPSSPSMTAPAAPALQQTPRAPVTSGQTQQPSRSSFSVPRSALPSTSAGPSMPAAQGSNSSATSGAKAVRRPDSACDARGSGPGFGGDVGGDAGGTDVVYGARGAHSPGLRLGLGFDGDASGNATARWGVVRGDDGIRS
ncbi:MAG: hypothetical protein WDN30_11410 [Pararobbsia sp.]